MGTPRTLHTDLDVTFDIKTLLTAINRIKPAGAARRVSSLPVLHCCLIEIVDGKIRVSVTDLDLWLSVPVDGTIHSTGDKVLLPNFAQLTKFLTQKKKGEVRITGEGDDAAVLVCGSTTVRLNTAPPSEYPVMIDAKGAEKTVTLNTAALVDVVTAASDEETRPILTGVNVTADGDYAATDSYRLHRVHTHEKVGHRILIPRRAVDVIAKQAPEHIIGKVKKDRDMYVEFPDGLLMQTRLIDGEFPNYQGLIPESAPVAVTWTDLDEVRTAVKEVIQMGAVLGIDGAVPVRWSAGPMHSVAGPVDSPESTEGVTGYTDKAHPALIVFSDGKAVVEQRFVGEMLTDHPAAFNPRFLHAALEGATFTEMNGLDAMKPWLLTEDVPHVGPKAVRQRLLMPVRVS